MNADKVTHEILGAAFEVANTLGCGFLEKVYERALVEELRARGLKASTQVLCEVRYKNYLVGEYRADLIVEGQVVVELKCVEKFAPEHMAQCINYLKATKLKLGLLLNFQRTKLEWKRVVNEF